MHTSISGLISHHKVKICIILIRVWIHFHEKNNYSRFCGNVAVTNALAFVNFSRRYWSVNRELRGAACGCFAGPVECRLIAKKEKANHQCFFGFDFRSFIHTRKAQNRSPWSPRKAKRDDPQATRSGVGGCATKRGRNNPC